MRQQQKLKNLYIRIHNGYALTFNDLAFLAEHDMDCCVKVCDSIVNGKPDRKAYNEKIEITEAPVTIDDNRRSIDVIISDMNRNRMDSDVFFGMRPMKVMHLISSQGERGQAKDRRYTYYNPVEQTRLVNAQV